MGAATYPAADEELSREQMVLRELHNRLDANDAVTEATLLDQYTPERVRVALATRSIPDGVQSTIDHYDASIHAPECDEVGLTFDLTIPAQYKQLDSKPIRGHGHSDVVTLSNDVLDRAGLERGDGLAIAAKPGEIRLSQE